MPLAETRNAIGVIARHLADQIADRTDATTVDVGRPEASARTAGPKLNLFLYALEHDGHMRNIPLDAGQRPPVWLSLKFLMTAVDEGRDSDSPEALDLLGQGLLALREIDSQRPSQLALADNPEPVKITFDSAGVELLSSLMQGTDELYRLSAAFEVRPILLTSVEGTGGAPLIRSIGAPAGPGVLVLPSMGPRLDRADPESFAVGESIRLIGGDLAADQVEVCFGDACVAVPSAGVGNREVTVSVPAPPVADLSPGSHALTLVKLLPSGRRLSSNAVLGRLRPVVTSVAVGALTPEGSNLHGTLTVTGARLGTAADATFAGFFAAGRLAGMFEATGVADQSTLTVTVPLDRALPPGAYRILVRANGEQALDAPEATWT